MKRMLINATSKEESRVALVDWPTLFDLILKTGPWTEKPAGNIERSSLGLRRRAPWLPSFKSNCPRAFPVDYVFQGRPTSAIFWPKAEKWSFRVNKEERGNTAALTTFLFLLQVVICDYTNNPRRWHFAVLKAMSGLNCEALLDVPEGAGLIVRTAV